MPRRRTRVQDLRADYDRLGQLLKVEADGSKAAALVRERRIVGALLETFESPVEVPFVDQLAARRNSQAGASGRASRRRQS